MESKGSNEEIGK